jgi:hypothetical protein
MQESLRKEPEKMKINQEILKLAMTRIDLSRQILYLLNN